MKRGLTLITTGCIVGIIAITKCLLDVMFALTIIFLTGCNLLMFASICISTIGMIYYLATGGFINEYTIVLIFILGVICCFILYKKYKTLEPIQKFVDNCMTLKPVWFLVINLVIYNLILYPITFVLNDGHVGFFQDYLLFGQAFP